MKLATTNHLLYMYIDLHPVHIYDVQYNHEYINVHASMYILLGLCYVYMYMHVHACTCTCVVTTSSCSV